MYTELAARDVKIHVRGDMPKELLPFDSCITLNKSGCEWSAELDPAFVGIYHRRGRYISSDVVNDFELFPFEKVATFSTGYVEDRYLYEAGTDDFFKVFFGFGDENGFYPVMEGF
jgi:hypothetical protein